MSVQPSVGFVNEESLLPTLAIRRQAEVEKCLLNVVVPGADLQDLAGFVRGCDLAPQLLRESHDLLDLLLARREPEGALDIPEVNEVLALMRRPAAKVLKKGNSQ